MKPHSVFVSIGCLCVVCYAVGFMHGETRGNRRLLDFMREDLERDIETLQELENAIELLRHRNCGEAGELVVGW